MSEVKYTVNGKYFKYFGVYVSGSKGLLGKLKPRERNSYNWAEYHGKQIDLSATKYEAREFTLECFIRAANIDELTERFNSFMIDFDKSGTQRIIVEPFGYKPYVFDVVLTDKPDLEKQFKDGEMFGTFNLSLMEPNPIKRILYTSNPNFTLSYNSSTETDIIIDGIRLEGGEVVNMTRTLNPRVIYINDDYGRNILRNASLFNSAGYYYWGYGFNNSTLGLENGSIKLTSGENVIGPLPIGLGVLVSNIDFSKMKNRILTVSFKVKSSSPKRLRPDVFSSLGISNIISAESKMVGTQWEMLSVTFKTLDVNYTNFYFYCFCDAGFSTGDSIWLREPKLEIGDYPTKWNPAPEDQHYISIAGNIDEITSFTTNAELLWDKI